MTEGKVIFEAGKNGCHTYRIPALLTLPDGRVLAFCEGRRDDMGDSGKIEIVMRISDDNAGTFGPQRVVAECGKDTIGNPCPVYDRDTGRIWMFLNTNLAEGSEPVILKNRAPRTIGAIYSDDRGETWSAFEDMSAQLKKSDWTWYAAGPCHALQMKSGRLVIPCNHGEFNPARGETRCYRSHVILSDDHGKTWRLGATVEGKLHGNETSVEETADGRLYLNARSCEGLPGRIAAYSDDGGESWRDVWLEECLPDPSCQGSVIAWPGEVSGCARPLLFSNIPHTRDEIPGDARRDITVRLSLDDGASWPWSRRIFEGRSAYGDLTVLSDGTVACLYECGVEHPYERIELKKFSIDELMK